VPSALEVARSRALAKLLSDFSLDAESSWRLVHRRRDPYGRSYRPWVPGGELGALAHDRVPVSSRKSESALASRLLEICSHINSPRVGSSLFPELRVASLSGASVSPWKPYLSQGSCSSTESQSTPTPAFRVLFSERISRARYLHGSDDFFWPCAFGLTGYL